MANTETVDTRLEAEETSIDNVFNVTECAHIQRLIEDLERFTERHYIIDAVIMNTVIVSQIIGDFDHLTSVYNIFSGDIGGAVEDRQIPNTLSAIRVMTFPQTERSHQSALNDIFHL